MSLQRRWWLGALVSVIAVTAFVSSGCCAMHHGPKGPIVVVSQTRTGASVDPIPISQKKHQQIVWRVRESITNVGIKLAGNPEPFVACSTSAGICRIICEHRLCFSGSINPLLKPPEAGIYYQYDFESSTAPASSDPGIRIDP
jgi:hypothetical protein